MVETVPKASAPLGAGIGPKDRRSRWRAAWKYERRGHPERAGEK